MKCFQLSPGVRDPRQPIPIYHGASRSWIGEKPFLPCVKSSAIRQKFEKYARLNFN